MIEARNYHVWTFDERVLVACAAKRVLAGARVGPILSELQQHMKHRTLIAIQRRLRRSRAQYG